MSPYPTKRVAVLIGISCIVLACSNSITTGDDFKKSARIDGEEFLSISTTQQEYERNDSIKVEVENLYTDELSIGPCFEIERETSNGWQNVSEELPCVTVGYPIQGGTTLVMNAGTPSVENAGNYRLRLGITVPYEASQETPSNPLNDTIANIPSFKDVDIRSNVFRVK